MAPRPTAFPRKSHVTTPSPPHSRRRPQRQTTSAKTGLPAPREVPTNPGLRHPRQQGADKPPSTSQPTPVFRPWRHFRHHRTPDKPRASASLINRPPQAPAPVRSCSAMTTPSGNHRGPDKSRAFRQRTVSGSTTRSDHSRQWRHFRQPMEPGHTSGICHPRQQTVFGLPPHSGHIRQWRPSRNRYGAWTHFGRTGPTCPPSSGHNSLLPPAAIPAAPGKFNAPFPKRRTSPVMTNDRVSSPVLVLGQNAAIMAPPSAAPYPTDHPAALPVSISVSLPLHPDHLFHPAPNAKTRKTQGLAGFGPDVFLPLTFLLCHK